MGDQNIKTSMVGLAEEVELRDGRKEEEEVRILWGRQWEKIWRYLWGWWWILQCWKQSAE